MSLEEREREFQRALSDWLNTGSQKSWEIMFERVLDCCNNICRKKLSNKGLTREKINDTALDAAIYIMDVIKRLDKRPKKLSSYCYSYCLNKILDQKTQFYERNVLRFSDLSEEAEKYVLGEIL